MIAFAVYRISVLFLGTRRRVPNYILSFGIRRIRNDAQTHLLPQQFFKNLHFVQQLGLAGFSFLAESFYQNYHGMIRICHGNIARKNARTQEQIGPSVHGAVEITPAF
jgi:hypothetical protein